jgi:hypothetical protein
MSNDKKDLSNISKEVADKVFTSDNGWTTVYEMPTVVNTPSVTLQIYVPLQILYPQKR